MRKNVRRVHTKNVDLPWEKVLRTVTECGRA